MKGLFTSNSCLLHNSNSVANLKLALNKLQRDSFHWDFLKLHSTYLQKFHWINLFKVIQSFLGISYNWSSFRASEIEKVQKFGKDWSGNYIQWNGSQLASLIHFHSFSHFFWNCYFISSNSANFVPLGEKKKIFRTFSISFSQHWYHWDTGKSLLCLGIWIWHLINYKGLILSTGKSWIFNSKDLQKVSLDLFVHKLLDHK
jgi:hypothetical protein